MELDSAQNRPERTQAQELGLDRTLAFGPPINYDILIRNSVCMDLS